MNGFCANGFAAKDPKAPKRIGSGAPGATDARFPAKSLQVSQYLRWVAAQSFINVSFQLFEFVLIIWWSRVVRDNCFSWPNNRHVHWFVHCTKTR